MIDNSRHIGGPGPHWQSPSRLVHNAHEVKPAPLSPEQHAQLKSALNDAFGKKHDKDKPRYDLLPPELMEAVSQVLTFGAAKYSARNWEKGMQWGRVFGASMRHMWAWWRGEKRDPETGFSHLWHAGACIAFLIAYEQRKIGEDDRHVPVQKEAGAPTAPA